MVRFQKTTTSTTRTATAPIMIYRTWSFCPTQSTAICTANKEDDQARESLSALSVVNFASTMSEIDVKLATLLGAVANATKDGRGLKLSASYVAKNEYTALKASAIGATNGRTRATGVIQV